MFIFCHLGIIDSTQSIIIKMSESSENLRIAILNEDKVSKIDK